MNGTAKTAEYSGRSQRGCAILPDPSSADTPRPDPLTPRQRRFLERAIATLELEPVNVKPLREIAEAIPAPIQAVQEIFRLGVQTGDLVKIADGIFYSQRQLESLRNLLRTLFADRPFTPPEARDALATSLRYSAPLLDFFDAQGFTIRKEGLRTLRPDP